MYLFRMMNTIFQMEIIKLNSTYNPIMDKKIILKEW